MTNIINSTNHVDLSRPGDATMQMNVQSRNITVEVSGSRFCIVPSLFKHIENLPWKKRKNKSLKLNANPDVFESVLQFFLSKKLPDPASLSSRRAKTLIEFVEPLDPLAVMPLVNYLQTFVSEKSSSDNKNSFMRRGLSTISSPFATKGPRSKLSKSSKANAGHTAKPNASQETSGNNSKSKKNSNTLPSNPTEIGMNAPPAITASIPTHIQHPITESTNIAEISVCSMDESSVSKLSLQSSPSFVATQQTGPQNEFSMAVSASSSAVSAHHQVHQAKNPFDQFTQYYQPSNAGTNQPPYTQQHPGFPKDSHARNENPFSTPMGYKNDNPTIVESRQPASTGFSNDQYRHYQPQPVAQINTKNTVALAQSQNTATPFINNSGKSNTGAIRKDPSNDHRPRSTTKILHTVKKHAGAVSTNVLFRKQEKMTHAEWCASASEYIV